MDQHTFLAKNCQKLIGAELTIYCVPTEQKGERIEVLALDTSTIALNAEANSVSFHGDFYLELKDKV